MTILLSIFTFLFSLSSISCPPLPGETEGAWPSAYDQIAANPYLAGNQSAVYPEPTKALTPSPKGYKPFYMSHYGRHGSRFINGNGYSATYNLLRRADQAGKLTPLGCQTMEQIRLIRDEAEGRDGELTPLGAQQHRDIASRMHRNFPEIFAARNATIEAHSTIVIRCILSMENALQQLSALNPKLRIVHDASAHDMIYMNHSEKGLDQYVRPARLKQRELVADNIKPERLMRLLFNDDAYWHDSINASDLMMNIFKLVTHVQNSELRHQMNLLSLFTTDELYALWQIGNSNWYVNGACSPLTQAMMPYSQRNLIHKMLQEADSCLALPYPSASLRYGHDGNVLPLVCFLQLDGIDAQLPLEDLGPKGWCDFNIIPMASNVQIIFYRTAKNDKPILVKVLRNEREARLPIPTTTWPYYTWQDVREYYAAKLARYDAGDLPN